MAYETTEPPLLDPRVSLLAAAARVELAPTRLQDERSLSVELRRNDLMERERFELSPNSLQDCRSAELSYHPKVNRRENWLRRRDLNPRTFAYEANALPPELLRNENICWRVWQDSNLRRLV